MKDIHALCSYLLLPLLAVAMLLAFARLLRGPSLPDRVVALDLLVSMGIGIVVVQAVNENQAALLDVAIVLSLIAFLSTVAFAFYVEESNRR